jgi:hypothetical protein
MTDDENGARLRRDAARLRGLQDYVSMMEGSEAEVLIALLDVTLDQYRKTTGGREDAPPSSMADGYATVEVRPRHD